MAAKTRISSVSEVRSPQLTLPVAFNPSSSGQVAVVMYEWADVKYLGVQAPNQDAGAALPVSNKLNYADE